MASETPANGFPISTEDLTKFSNEACDATLKDVEGYQHDKIKEWTSQIIDTVIASLVKATTPEPTTTTSSSSDNKDASKPAKKPQPAYRFCVNCTIIQQEVDEEGKPGSAGKRGMYSAAGAYWDVARDGMWTYKYQGAEEKGIELVLNVAWFGTH